MFTIADTARPARFLSDLHLRAERPDLVDRFARFLEDCTLQGVGTLFILGDLFEYWIGDDDLADPFNARICALLRGAADAGITIHFLAGNRDFLIGDGFATAAGLRRIGDDAVKVSLGGTAALLLHGDTLCTDDVAYQRFRRMVRAPEWQRDFLIRPLAERRAEVAALRRRSAEAMKAKSEAIMDVNAEAVRQALEGADCRTLIHGHTHRPGRESIRLHDGSAERWTLSDWDTDRGDALEADADGLRRLDWSR